MGNKYRQHLHSDNWHGKQEQVLKLAGYRCALFPFIPIGRGRRYAVHHTNYRRLGNEVPGVDIVALSPIGHFVIHVLLGLSARARHNRMGRFPNIFQRIAHMWCRLPWPIKLIAVVYAIWRYFVQPIGG